MPNGRTLRTLFQISILSKYYFQTVSVHKRTCVDREGVAGGWLNLHTENFHIVKFPSSIILIKLRRMVLTGFSEIWCENH
jgi:hypothetical protein